MGKIIIIIYKKGKKKKIIYDIIYYNHIINISILINDKIIKK